MRAALIYVFVIVALWLSIVWKKRDIEQRFSSFALGQADKTLHRVGNPIYPKLVEVAQQYGVDVSFMKNPIHNRNNNLFESEVFTKPPKYYDILIFGDSALVWSFSPQIVAQASGKRVAFIGCESAYANKGMIRFAERVTKTYLKDGGITVFLFAWWTWGMDPNGHQVVAQLEELVQSARSNRIRQPLELALNSMFGLPRLAVYDELLQPRLAPAAYELAHKEVFGRGCTFLSWGIGTNAFLLYCNKNSGVYSAKDPHSRDVADSIVSDCSNYEKNAAVTENMREFVVSQLPHKVLALPFSESPLTTLSCEAQKVADNIILLDLPKIARDKYRVKTLDFEMANHLANTSPIVGSVILGRELGERARSFR